ncbi:MAG TPA: DUF4149 domain-containing protein [Gemmatimonadaceae bacterium]
MTSLRASRASDAGSLALAAAWLGAGILFAAVVAPAAFAVLPSRSLAGAVVGRVLPALFYCGMATGVALMLLQARASGRLVTAGTVAGLVTAVSCAIGQLVIAPRIERVRAAIPGPVEELPATDARRAEFGRLHASSVVWLGVGMLGAAAGGGIALVRLRRD